MSEAWGYPSSITMITRDANGVPFDLAIRIEALRAASRYLGGVGKVYSESVLDHADAFERYLRGLPRDPSVGVRR